MDNYATIRNVLPLVGRTILEITQHDEIEWLAGEQAYFCLHFDDGSTLRIVVIEDDMVFYET